MLAIASKGMNGSVCNAEVKTLSVGTGEALCVHALGGSTAAFHLAPGTHRSRDWPCTRGGSGGETTGGAIVWAAGLEQTVPRIAQRGCGRANPDVMSESHAEPDVELVRENRNRGMESKKGRGWE